MKAFSLHCLFFSACTSPQDKDRIAQLEKQTKELQEQVKQQKEMASFALQEKCSEAARKAYAAEGWDKPKIDTSSSYTNHYNKKLNSCFLAVERSEMHPAEDRIFDI